MNALAETIDAGPIEIVDGRPRLVGGRCQACAEVMFPLRERCPSCASGEVERILLPSRGSLWTWTVQGFEPKSPPYVPGEEPFEPFGVGYVELADHLRVESRLSESSPDRLQIGMEMELVAEQLEDRWEFAFAPAGEERRS